MSKNYTAIHYIQKQLQEFNPKFVGCVTRCFNLIDRTGEPDGCLSNSIALYICAKEYGYDPVLCYGLCSLDGKEFYHAWLEIGTTVVDLSIYGNVNFSPYSLWRYKLKTPYIGSYEDSFIRYGRFQFDADWPLSLISKMEGKTFEEYVDGAPGGMLWKLTCKFLDRTPTPELIRHLRGYIEGKKIETGI